MIVGYLLLLAHTLLANAEGIVLKAYAKRYGGGGMLMNAIIALFAALFFLVTDLVRTDGLYVPPAMLPLALINAFLYGAGFYSAFLAFKVGPYGLTRLVSSFSLLFSIFYGIFFLKEETTVLTYIGIAMIFAAMFLINIKGKGEKGDEEGGISLRWLVYILITVVSNGFIAILTRMQQIRFENACSNEFNMISIGGSFLILAVLGLIIDRDKLGTVAKKGLLYGAASGLCCGAKNLLLLAIYLFLPLSVISPTSSGLGMISAFLISFFFYKEKYSPRQLIGVLLGASAVVLLAL